MTKLIKHRSKVAITVLVLVCIVAIATSTQADEGILITRMAIASGGASGQGGELIMTSLVGQVVAEPGSSDNYGCTGGFMGGEYYSNPGCCVQPMRGNVDNDLGDIIDISDLVYLVDYMFTGGAAPICWVEANIDGSGPIGAEDGAADVDISDLVYLVDYMFTGGPPPVACP